jgi:hypothetical protein
MSNTFRTHFSRFVSLALICLFSLTAYLHAAEKNAAYRAALESINAANLTDYVGRLADPKMEGREAGTRGGRAAADYLAEQFAKLHLKPIGKIDGFQQPFPPNYRNVLGLIPGNDPKLQDELVLVGAHYDHLGFGRRYSLAGYGKVHPGADDNASGASALMELAHAFSLLPDPPKRSIVLAAWDGEEEGMLGAKYFVAHPPAPLDKIVAAFNLDMIGRLRDDHLYVYGARSGCGWRRILSRQNEDPRLRLEFVWECKPNADYYPFFDKGIPVLMLYTGMHENYHRPSDTADLINGEGLSRVVRLLFGVVYELAETDERLPYRKAAGRETPETEKSITQQAFVPADRLGATADAKPAAEGGVRVLRVASGSPADKAGLKPGDRILRCAGQDMRLDSELVGIIATADSPVALTFQRPGQDKPEEISIPLTGPPLRLGIAWRVDEAEPAAIILTHVVPGTPAARAGLLPGDRIYQVDGRDFADENAFLELLKSAPDPLELMIDREGRLSTPVIRIKPAEPLKRAA